VGGLFGTSRAMLPPRRLAEKIINQTLLFVKRLLLEGNTVNAELGF